MNRTNKHFGACGFTIVELLVTLVIIGIVLSLMLPAFSAVKNAATVLKQKAQFTQIEVGLQGYFGDFGDYPDDYHTIGTMTPDVYSSRYSGAQILAEAMVGRDGFGVHKKTQFLLGGGIDTSGDGISNTPSLYAPDSAVDKNLRFGPYIEADSANAVRVDNLYDSGAIGTGDELTYVLSDMFGKTRNKATGKAAGMPILYYKANDSNYGHAAVTASPYGYDTNIYTINVNSKVFGWGIPFKSNFSQHEYANTANWGKFYAATHDPNFTNPVRPHRSGSFILHSAGLDGIYGTGDDVFNFEENN